VSHKAVASRAPLVRVSGLCSRAGGKGPAAPGGNTRARAGNSHAPVPVLFAALLTAVALASAGCGSANEAAPGGESGVSETAPPPEASSLPTDTLPVETLTTSATTTEAVKAPLPDGRHFGFIKSIDLNASPATMVFDLAYFLTGDEANAAAAERGDEVPVPNDYYIVNDNPKLRMLQVSPNVDIELVDWKNCCDRVFKPNWQKFQDSFALDEPPAGRYKGKFTNYWVTVNGGEVVQIQEQFVP